MVQASETLVVHAVARRETARMHDSLKGFMLRPRPYFGNGISEESLAGEYSREVINAWYSSAKGTRGRATRRVESEPRWRPSRLRSREPFAPGGPSGSGSTVPFEDRVHEYRDLALEEAVA